MTEAYYARAVAFVEARHAGKSDPLGQPVSDHFIRVADRLRALVPTATPAQIVAALLHDALEPGESTIEELHAQGSPPAPSKLSSASPCPPTGGSISPTCATLSPSAIGKPSK